MKAPPRPWDTAAAAAAAVALLLALAACGRPEAARAPPAARAASAAMPYADALAALDTGLARAARGMVAQPRDPAATLEALSLRIERARLSGDYADYAAATELLDEAARRGGAHEYPCVAAGRLDFALHRLTQATAQLRRCPATASAEEITALEADIAFYSGHYAAAEERYRRLLNARSSVSNYIRLALFRSKTGAAAEAAALLEAAEQRNHADSAALRAWLKLQRGLLAYEQQGREDVALALYLGASEALPGWWLVDEHLAELRTLQGSVEQARALWEDLVRRSGQPEHLDALARLLRDGGDPAAAAALVQKAGQIYRERLQRFPEATYGHAVDHYLSFGTPAEALALARRNAAARPFGEARILLAAALFRAGRGFEAQREIVAVRNSGWDTVQLHAIEAQIHAALGDAAAAQAARAQALSRNPYALRLYPLPPLPAPEQPDLRG